MGHLQLAALAVRLGARRSDRLLPAGFFCRFGYLYRVFSLVFQIRGLNWAARNSSCRRYCRRWRTIGHAVLLVLRRRAVVSSRLTACRNLLGGDDWSLLLVLNLWPADLEFVSVCFLSFVMRAGVFFRYQSMNVVRADYRDVFSRRQVFGRGGGESRPSARKPVSVVWEGFRIYFE